jgi:hypothetical protein
VSIQRATYVDCDADGCRAFLVLPGTPTFPHAEAERDGWATAPKPGPGGALDRLDYCPNHRPEETR